MPRRSRRSLLSVGAALLAAGFARAKETQYFEPPAHKPQLVFHWDALARYDIIDHLRVRPDIKRWRFEFRPQLELAVSDRFKVGVRAIGDLGTDHNEDNARNFDNYRSRGATIERWFVEGKPGDWTIRAGSFGMPLVASEMLWDRDIQTPGLSISRDISAGASSFTVTAAGFYGPQREGDQTRIGAGQIVWRLGDADRLALEVAGSYWHIDPDDLKTAYFRQNYTEFRDGARVLGSRYRVADLLVRLRFPIGKVPLTVSLDGAVNNGVRDVAVREKSAFEASLTAGRLGNPWDWRAFVTYQYIERDAILGAYNTDDWWFHTWYRGVRAGVAVTVLPQVFVQGIVMFQRRLDLPTTLNRVTVDLVKMF